MQENTLFKNIKKDRDLLDAINDNNIEKLTLLIEEGLDVNILINNVPLVLHTIVYCHNEALKVLIDNGINLNININNVPLVLYSILYHNNEALKILIDNDINLDININNLTLVAYAIMYHNNEALKILIDNGADIDIFINNQPLVVFSLLFNNEATKLLIEHGVKTVFKNQEYNLIDFALVFCNTEIFEMLKEKGYSFKKNCCVTLCAEDKYLCPRENIIKIIDTKKDIVQKLQAITENKVEVREIHKNDTTSTDILISILNKYIELYEFLKNNCKKDITNFESFKEKTEVILNDISKIDEIKLKKSINLENVYEDFKNSINIDGKIQNLKEKLNSTKKKKSELLSKIYDRETKLSNIIDKFQNIINIISVNQDKFIELKLLDSVKFFISNGGEINYVDEEYENETALIVASINNHEDVVELLIKEGADINAQTTDNKSALFYAIENNYKNIIKILLENGADVNIKMYNAESLERYAKYKKDFELLDLIQNSPTYIKNNNNPRELVEILSNFTIDKPIKYTTHNWEFGKLNSSEYKNFEGYMKAVKNQFENIKDNLEELSPNLYKKIYTFLLEESPDNDYSWCHKTHINIGWSSLKGLKEHCDNGNKPDSYILPQPIIYENQELTVFKDIIDLFKQEIEIRENFKNLETLFVQQKRKLCNGRNSIYNLDLSGSKLTKQFYTDVENFSNILDKIFSEIKTRTDYPNIEVITNDLEDRSIEIRITQIDSYSSRSAEELLERAKKAGDIVDIKNGLTNLCDWSIESSFENQNFRLNFLQSNNLKDIELLKNKPKGFTHILRFYKV